MLEFIHRKLSAFRDCFSRSHAYAWSIVVIMGLLSRTDHHGVTSIINALGLQDRAYDLLIKSFHSTAFDLKDLVNRWVKVVKDDGHLFKLGNTGRNLLIGDGIKLPKEGRRMPGVKKLHQESEDSSKAEFIFGHMLGSVGVVTTNGRRKFCTPLVTSIQDGLKEVADWAPELAHYAKDHITQILEDSYGAAKVLGPSYLALDRYFLTSDMLDLLDTMNAVEHRIDIVTRAKKNCVAYEFPPVPDPHKRGRKPKKGDPVKVMSLFETREKDLISGKAMMYGAKADVRYLPVRLLWGRSTPKELLFVLVKSERGECILVSTDVTLDPRLVIEAYADRFQIEMMFKSLKHTAGSFAYHFWSRSMPKLDRWAKKGDPSALSKVIDPEDQEHVIETVEATERFIHFTSIALGLAQMIALRPRSVMIIEKSRYVRTRTPGEVSEETVFVFFQKYIYRLLLENRANPITQIIKPLQNGGFEDEVAV